MMGTIERELHERYIQTHRKFFPRPPVFPMMREAEIIKAQEPPPIPPAPPIMSVPLSPQRAQRLIGFQETKARMKIIRHAVCIAFDISPEDLMGTRRSVAICLPRHVYSYLTARLTKASLPQIARSLNNDHTTILHATRRIAKKIAIDFAFAERMRRLEQNIRLEFGEGSKPRACVGRYVEHRHVLDYLLLGWMHVANLNEYAALLIWPCDCRFVEPKA